MFEYTTPLNMGKIKRSIRKKGYCKLPDGIRPLSVIFPDKTRWDKGIGFSEWDLTGIPILNEAHIIGFNINQSFRC